MFGNILLASESSRASSADTDFRRRSASEIALTVLSFVFVGASAALFFVWLAFDYTGGRASGALSADVDCVSFGRGWARCASHTAGDGGSNGAAEARSGCTSAGRGCSREGVK
jgi:hypothetical protein